MANLKKHPQGLYVLFFSEMWERFSYYGMRALLVLYLTSKMVNGGFEMLREDALQIYAVFTGLVYLTPIIGGLLADKILGQRKSIYIGAFLMAFGQFSLAISEWGGDINMRTTWLHVGLGLLIIGNGFFKPNISTIVGKLYSENDPRKDSAFTIFYMGINLGALIAPLIAGSLGEEVNWSLGFASAGTGMLLSIVWFYTQGQKLGSAGFPPKRVFSETDKFRLNNRDRLDILFYIVGVIVLVYGSLSAWKNMPVNAQTLIKWIIGIVGITALLYVIITNTKGKNEWSRVGTILILCFANIFFWSGFEQAGGTFNLFAAQNTDRSTFFGEIPASIFQSINPVFIILLAPVFSTLWIRLSNIGRDPRTPVKFGIGLLLLSMGFVVMSMAYHRSETGILVSPMWLLIVYFLHTTGELCLSPIGLSMITKLSPQKIVSVMMGVWFASMALANYLAGMLESILNSYLPNMQLFTFLTITSGSFGIVILLISPLLNKMMKGIH